MKRDDLKRISRQIKRLERTPLNTDRGNYQPPFVQSVDHVILRANGAITALSGSVPGTGSAVIYDQSSVGSTLVSRGSSVTVVNLGGVIADTTYFSAHRAPPNQPVWVADTAQAPASPSNPGDVQSMWPSMARINDAFQSISNSTELVKFQFLQHAYPGSSAITWSTTNHDARFSQTGVYSLKWIIPMTSMSANLTGRFHVRLDGTTIQGALMHFSCGAGENFALAGSIDHAITSTTQAITFVITGASGLTLHGTTSDGFVRFDATKIRTI